MDGRIIAKLRYGCATAALIVSTTSALAQTAQPSTGSGTLTQEITVTATRREEQTSKVPESIVVYNQKSLDAQGIRSIDDLVRTTPGVDISRLQEGNGSLTNITIRGILSNSESPTTGIYIDDAPTLVRENGLSLFGAAIPALFDLDRVEVLRGPQGTLFGAGSEGGAIRFVTAAPSLTTYSGYARAELAGLDGGGLTGEAGGAVGGPIIQDKLGFRLSVTDRHDGGYVDRVNWQTGQVLDKNANSGNTLSARGALKADIGGWLTATASLIYNRQSVRDTDFYWVQLSDPSKDQFRNGKNLREPSVDKLLLPSLKLDADLGFADLISATSYLHRNARTIADEGNPDGTFFAGNPYIPPNAYAPELDTARYRQISQEVRLQSKTAGPLQWIAGAFYVRLRDREHQEGDATPFADIFDSFGLPLYQGKYAWFVTEHSTDTQLAGFGDVSYQLTGKLKVSAGVRGSKLKDHYTRDAIGPLYGGELRYDLRHSDTAVTPKFNVSWQARPDTMLYATVSEGVRPGGVNRSAFPLPACLAAVNELGLSDFPKSYNLDKLWNYEVGAKGKLFGGKVRYEGSLFYDRWHNIQRLVAPPECDGSTFTANLGDATSKGFDLSVYAQFTHELSLNLQVAYTDAKFTKTVEAGNTFYVNAGDTLDITPWVVTATGRYERPLWEGVTGYFQGQYQLRSTNHGRTEVQDPLDSVFDPDIPIGQGWQQVNLRTGVLVKGFDISLYVDNLNNAHPRTHPFHAEAGDPLFLDRTIRPRTIGATATYNF